ncbi:MAG: VOC family protein [bacterium]
MTRIDSLSHVGIWVRDLEKSIRWYEEMLGLIVTDKLGPNDIEPAAPHGIAWLRCSDEHHNIVLVELPPEEAEKPLPFGGRGALQQVAFDVESKEALYEAHEFLAGRGVEIVHPPRPQNWSDGVKFYFLDPDGNKLEINWGAKKVGPEYGKQYGKWVTSPETS